MIRQILMFLPFLYVPVVLAIGDVPVVPVSVLEKARKEGTQEPAGKNTPSPQLPRLYKVQQDGSGEASDQKEDFANAKYQDVKTVVVKPGVNQIFPVAAGHPNRIVTPFVDPKVETTSDDTIYIKDNVIYVAPKLPKTPITMYVTESDDESVALSLTLAPYKIPPVETRLVLEASQERAGAYAYRAKRWEESQPYLDTIREVMRAAALEEIPQGYTFGWRSATDPVPDCAQKGYWFDFERGQVMKGHHFTLVIGTVQKTDGREQDPHSEGACRGSAIAAVGFWPDYWLAPGQKTEVFVLMRNDDPTEMRQRRPSLMEAP